MPTFSPPGQIVFPDVEAMLVGWVPSVLPVLCSTRVPNPRPSRWVRIVRTGGPSTMLVVDQAQITVECWNDDIVGASDDARTLRAALRGLQASTVGDVQVVRVREWGGPANLPDAHSSQPRYTWTVSIDVRGTPQS
jgi:hypothetical protein